MIIVLPCALTHCVCDGILLMLCLRVLSFMKVVLGEEALKKQLKVLEKKLELQQKLAISGSEQEKVKVKVAQPNLSRGEKFVQSFISSRDGPVKSTETRQK